MRARGNVLEAIDILKEGLRKTVSPRNHLGDPWLAFCLGNDYRDLDQFEDAKTWYQYAIENLPMPKYKEKAIFELVEIKRLELMTKRVVTCPECGHVF